MTGNKEKLDDFVQVKGGIVKFGGGDGRISGKGTIKTSKLDFENVYYVEELQHFNLFSVSQICDKKNKVLFTDTDCLVLSEDFPLLDESQVVLRIPRKCDLYTFSISELQPEQNVTCLVAKASLDESTRWHRRMAHVNFKTINKLAKEEVLTRNTTPWWLLMTLAVPSDVSKDQFSSGIFTSSSYDDDFRATL
ncbi:putative ribonuclease H-like domain-containing protein, partial [Tanacetum coccineum]